MSWWLTNKKLKEKNSLIFCCYHTYPKDARSLVVTCQIFHCIKKQKTEEKTSQCKTFFDTYTEKKQHHFVHLTTVITNDEFSLNRLLLRGATTMCFYFADIVIILFKFFFISLFKMRFLSHCFFSFSSLKKKKKKSRTFLSLSVHAFCPFLRIIFLWRFSVSIPIGISSETIRATTHSSPRAM